MSYDMGTLLDKQMKGGNLRKGEPQNEELRRERTDSAHET